MTPPIIELEIQKKFQRVQGVVKNIIIMFILMNINLCGQKIKIESNG